MLIVQKYGGSSVADKDRIINAASRIADEYKKGNDLVVVVSAMGDTTDDLIKAATDINPNASKREMDMLLSTGEQQSAALMAMALMGMGIPAISLNAWQMGVFTTSKHGNARIETISAERIKNELEEKKVVIAAGFQGINLNGDITTLGRGGSDTTAVALAAALKADKCEIFTDVEGVFTADPRVVDNAEKLDYISYDEMLDYTTLGAKVLHNRSVEFAKRYCVPLSVRSSFSDNEGTAVCPEKSNRLVTGIASDGNTELIKVKGLQNSICDCADIFSRLSEKGISADIIMTMGEDSLVFTVPFKDKDETLAVLKGYETEADDSFSKVSVIGIGLETSNGTAASVFSTLKAENINIELITVSEVKISVLVNKKYEKQAVKALHNRLIGTK